MKAILDAKDRVERNTVRALHRPVAHANPAAEKPNVCPSPAAAPTRWCLSHLSKAMILMVAPLLR
jgi:hypothetical protein